MRLLVAVTLVLLLGAANARAEENLVVNGSFEEVAGGQFAAANGPGPVTLR